MTRKETYNLGQFMFPNEKWWETEHRTTFYAILKAARAIDQGCMVMGEEKPLKKTTPLQKLP